MADLTGHCATCQKLLGEAFEEVHAFLDYFFPKYGMSHRQILHHQLGVELVAAQFGEEIRNMWGDEAAIAAKIHILVDCWGIPSKADYSNGGVNSNGFTEESTEAEAKMMLQEIVKK